MSKLDENGREVLDQTPIVIHVKNRRISQWDDVRAFIRNELSRAAENSGAETFEEANDFYMEDDPSPPLPLGILGRPGSRGPRSPRGASPKVVRFATQIE